MESGRKQGSEETSSEENDHRLIEQVKEDTSATTKRSYECTFCKRGFTNAQALGGHMNIHRKDRTKNKQVVTGSSFSSKPTMTVNEDYMNPRYIAGISGEQARYHPVLEAQSNYFMYYQPSVASPINPRAFHGSEFHLPRSQYNSLSTTNDQERPLGANLSLGVSSKCEEDKEDELDLELRLGHNP
ncbi:hypothetical protein LWI29_010229 [Acer saccharum]|uniref:C2H2-type domain-containing protein n=1 Tax=Acer saccharum TaxID=4024 RepID=A0AA39TEA8_ACESA|nr:hypothetical protein LWI29_010229 [Acer saccharum]KAK1592724.1 hypothetical protein Q3G72_029231 [Acer saccharum]